ncbi:MAG: glycosyltransferase [Rhodospirillales bacterium]|nr:glycosyltransferase [Rhodospirillales bacterium]
MNPRNHLIVFVKAPRLGRVKTRLAADIGLVPAWEFYRRTMTDVVGRLCRDPRWRCWIAVTPDGAVSELRSRFPRSTVIPQGRGDLGRRMARVCNALPPGPAVIVGTDSPGVARAHVAQAFRALGRRAAVFGPAADGGYWLVGLRRRPAIPDVFRNVRWSTRFALADTLANLACAPALLETLVDIDDGDSLARWRAGGRKLSGGAP